MHHHHIMAASDEGFISTPPHRLSDTRIMTWLVLAAILVGSINRIVAGMDAPIWFDETFSAVIASQAKFGDLVRWCLNELGGPVYYMLLWAWEKLAGDSGLALRLPSLGASLAAPVLILFAGHPDWRTRLCWSGVCAVWIPGFAIATEARSYALLFLLATAQSIAFLRLLSAPSLRRAGIWVAVTDAIILTHYFGLFISAIQGMIFLIARRRSVTATWPALLGFAPVIVWMLFHMSFLARLSGAGVAWQSVVPPRALWFVPELLFGSLAVGYILCAGMAVGAIVACGSRLLGASAPPLSSEALVAISGWLALAVLLGLAMVRPSFTPRYATMVMPAILFGVALWMRGLDRWTPYGAPIILAMMIAIAFGPLRDRLYVPELDHRYGFNLMQPSAWLAKESPSHLMFLWDNPTGTASDPARLAEVAGYFFQREGRPVEVEIAQLPAAADPNPYLIEHAARQDAALIWIYDRNVSSTRGRTYPADLRSFARAGLVCRDFGRLPTTIIACYRKRAPARR
ncbi:hypothetical protein WG908_10840 [Sphingobium sp. AN641]|uniref:hypothetical protein n=1 Tax=Sphingobium sp. AN641 TaxID=3133443 RepID=UPI0030C058E5